MSYNDLPVEEKMQMAAGYAQLMAEDQRPPEQIMAELQLVFGLDRSQAAEAMIKVRWNNGRKYIRSYREAVRTAAICFSLAIVVVISYFFVGHRTGTSIFYLAGLLFLCGLVVLLLTRKEKSPPKPPPQPTTPSTEEKKTPPFDLFQ